jgi:uncharacterized protein YbaR (Trm112 family)
MAGEPKRNLSFDATILDQLACPACLCALRLDADRLVCEGCGRGYPIVDGIPVLIAGRSDETRDKVSGA